MSTQIDRIAMLNTRAFSGPTWHGDSIETIMARINFKQAAAEPTLGRFSIWQHVLHMIYWKERLIATLNGEDMPTGDGVPIEDNWPTIEDSSEQAWLKTIAELKACEQTLQEAIARLPEEKLIETAEGRDYDLAFALYNIPMHDAYHAAQIDLLHMAFR